MRKEHRRLTDLGKTLGIHFRNDNRKRNRDQNAENDEDGVVNQRISEHGLKVDGIEQGSEVADTIPSASDEQIVQEAFSCFAGIVKERDDYTKHGRVAENQIPECSRKVQNEQLKIVKRRTRALCASFTDLNSLTFLDQSSHLLSELTGTKGMRRWENSPLKASHKKGVILYYNK